MRIAGNSDRSQLPVAGLFINLFVVFGGAADTIGVFFYRWCIDSTLIGRPSPCSMRHWQLRFELVRRWPAGYSIGSGRAMSSAGRAKNESLRVDPSTRLALLAGSG
ncbi:MAG: hypothetical protein ACLQU2_09370 [Candidatus Binataceae bacterium]